MTSIPVDVQQKLKKMSLFQQRVYEVCAQIPAGEVRTYSWIANKIGRPGAARAVGTVLGRNPFAPIIPCHRVVRHDGGLGGYSGKGGLKTKVKLLRNEGCKKY